LVDVAAGEADEERLESADAAEVLAWAAKRFAPRLAFAFGFGPEGCVLFDLIARLGLDVDVFTLDTGLLFPETRTLWRLLEQRYGRTIRAVQPAQSLDAQARTHGEALWEREPDRCCHLRKVEPLARALRGHDAWISAIRREQTAARALSRVLEHDPVHGLVKINPLAGWTRERVWHHLTTHDVPVNVLHAHGYPSVGCIPCTGPIAPGESERAGRWRGRGKTECGIHSRPRTMDVFTATEGAAR
jgi:phosphoadenylyl-sulfate reductase (thioredoxin)